MRNSSQFKRALSLKDGEMNGVNGVSPLRKFVKAKQKINSTFGHIGKFLEDCNTFLLQCEIADDSMEDVKNFSSEVSGFLAQVSSISEVLARDQMKVAFFGRTSNGKSTTVNAMLQDKILPMGIGHTTNCFLSVHGSDQPDPYILTAGSNDKRNVKSLSQLAHALCDDKLEHSSLVQVFWPKTRCKLLSEDVVLVDSPGIDVSPDLDLWIDKHCLDADVFVLVANAESTLMVTEKNFFHKVNQRLSRPNIFILNNRWDASASEPDTMELVKNQHLQRNISFLVDELKCVVQAQAEDRVFFVSSKETLMTRMQKHKGMPQEGGAIHVEGFQARQMEFENFERKFEECISKSAIQTKFESHAVSGLKIANVVKDIMEQVVGCAFQRRSRLEKAKKEQEDRLEYVKEQLEICSHDAKRRIKEITSVVEGQVTDAMTEEIGRLGLLVNEFDHPFHPHPGFLKTYKKELYGHLERGLGRNMTARCSNSQTQVVNDAQRDMADRLRSLLPPESPEFLLEPAATALDFQASYKLDVPSLCVDFREDIEFHFSLGWQAILRKFLAPHNASLAIALGANLQRNVRSLVPTAQYSTQSTEGRTATSSQVNSTCEMLRRPEGDEVAAAVITGLASVTSRTGTLVVIAGGLIWKTVGWKFIALCAGLYSGVYVIERLRWNNGAKEKAFKKQFVEYATEKLHLVVSFTSANCSIQVQQELSSSFVKLKSLVQRAKESLEENIIELCKEITRLEKIENEAKILRNKASWFESELSQFITEFGLAKCKM
ncbi:mitofusin-2-like [Acropora muricata]|uniref:mitofusin-2-like n=1 Tax=Acropora muricata TaxID=159855 RepID=UPI0034E5135B